MSLVGEALDWVGTHTRRFIRDDLGFSQRVAQNVGDGAELIAGFFAPSGITKGVGSVGKIGESIFRTSKEASIARFEKNVVTALKTPTRIDVIHEPEMIRMALAAPTEWKGQFKLVREFTQTSGNAELSKLYSKEVLFKDPKSGQMFRVLQRNDIDPNYIGKYDKSGNPLSNLELMKKGQAPYTNSGERMNVHHVGQHADGPFAEVTESTHRSFPHKQFGRNNPHPTNPVVRAEFDPIRRAYWRARADEFK